MKTNWYKVIGMLILWTIFVVNVNLDLFIWENLLVGLGAWSLAQDKELEE